MEGPPAAQLGDPVNMGHGPQRTSRSHGMPRGAQMVRGALRSQPSSCARVPAAAQNREQGGSHTASPGLCQPSLPTSPGPPGFFARACGGHQRGWHPAGRHFPLSLCFHPGDLLSPSPLPIDALSTPRLLPAAGTRAGH